MVATPSVHATAAVAEAVAVASADFHVTKAALQAVVNFPTPEVHATAAMLQSADNHPTQLYRATSASLQVVCLGRQASPYLRPWTFTLDAHDYLVLQLQEETLVYDFAMESWYVWGTGEGKLWRGQIGIDWNANIGAINMALGGRGVSNVLVGDYSAGSLYFLAPELPEDSSWNGETTQVFTRVIYGQRLLRGHGFVSCAGVEVTSSAGVSSGASNLDVTLYTSDDRGVTFNSAGVITTEEGVYDLRLSWRSLGSYTAPGRLFKLEDRGALTRVDDLEELGDGTAES